MNKLLSSILFLSLFLLPVLTQADTAFERITKTGKINCGYGVSDPWLYFDFEENKVKGIAVTISEAMAERLSVELVWGEETGWANLPTSLYTGRVDLACSTLWNGPSKAAQIAYTQPIYYNALYPYVRADETRFNSIEDINSP